MIAKGLIFPTATPQHLNQRQAQHLPATQVLKMKLKKGKSRIFKRNVGKKKRRHKHRSLVKRHTVNNVKQHMNISNSSGMLTKNNSGKEGYLLQRTIAEASWRSKDKRTEDVRRSVHV